MVEREANEAVAESWHGDARTAIVDAIERRFLVHGTDRVDMDDSTEAADIARRTIFRKSLLRVSDRVAPTRAAELFAQAGGARRHVIRARDEQDPDLEGSTMKRRILEGAREVFFLNGYAGARIDQITRQAGVSVGSVYRYFDGKDALFRSLIAGEAERIARELPPVDHEALDPASALRRTGFAVFEALNDPVTIATLRLVIGALGRFPRLGEEFLRTSLGPTVDGIADFLDVRVAVGDVRVGNSRAAAEEFARQSLAHVIERVLLPCRVRPTAAECAVQVKRVLQVSGISFRWNGLS